MKTSGNVGLILIGDELLNGSRQDKHLANVIALLRPRGLSLSWVRMVGDDYQLLVETFRNTLKTDEIVFSFGGIGATPDDLTRQCITEALGLNLYRHPQLTAILEKRFGAEAYPNRIRMAELPDGAVLIPNPINQIAGFKIYHHHCVPGFPNMALPMVEWSLDTFYSHCYDTDLGIDQRWILQHTPESELIPMMEELLKTFPDVRLSSLPSTENRFQIDFGLKGKRKAVSAAADWFEKRMQAEKVDCTRVNQAL
ncbi:competence/damage-inducible protein A [Thiolinea disciformis]|uniref:competence/damage-inducible protein A n=1 Tax=Thiolinea disciformis TaxID=125614 RepID=UPI00035EC98F|nr:competence/damage-inducible protein A [Thiolinea disciformis]